MQSKFGLSYHVYPYIANNSLYGNCLTLFIYMENMTLDMELILFHLYFVWKFNCHTQQAATKDQ